MEPQVRLTVRKRILRIAWPAIVSNVTVPLLGLADTAIVGHLGSAVYMCSWCCKDRLGTWLYAS